VQGSGGEVETTFEGPTGKPEASSSSESPHRPDQVGEEEPRGGGGGGVVLVPVPEVGT
jgi:hypothetical protein